MTLPWMIEAPAPAHAPLVVRICAGCRHFQAEPLALENALPGFGALSSGFASVRGDDGHCRRHDRLIGERGSCAAFSARRSN